MRVLSLGLPRVPVAHVQLGVREASVGAAGSYRNQARGRALHIEFTTRLSDQHQYRGTHVQHGLLAIDENFGREDDELACNHAQSISYQRLHEERSRGSRLTIGRELERGDLHGNFRQNGHFARGHVRLHTNS